MQEKILEMLKQEKENGYVSGQELCERLGVSRTAVWKVIRQLKEAGYVIARRTVAKYREQLGIPVARMRKEI